MSNVIPQNLGFLAAVNLFTLHYPQIIIAMVECTKPYFQHLITSLEKFSF